MEEMNGSTKRDATTPWAAFQAHGAERPDGRSFVLRFLCTYCEATGKFRPLQAMLLSYHVCIRRHKQTSSLRTCLASPATSPHATRLVLTETLVDGERYRSMRFSSCASIGRIFSFSASSLLRVNS